MPALHKRHAGRVTSGALVAGNLSFDPETLAIRFGGKDVKLPPKCVRLLEALIARPNRVFSRSELENAVWGGEQETGDTLRSHMHVLRRELTQAAATIPSRTCTAWDTGWCPEPPAG